MSRRSLNRDLLEQRVKGKTLSEVMSMLAISPHRRHQRMFASLYKASKELETAQ